MKFSIAMATFNGQSFLEQQLDSLNRQTRLPDELVIVDDNSSDQTLMTLKKFVETTLIKVRLFENEHRLGYRRNFAKAVGLCEGDVIAFCDQDDIWLPEKIATLEKLFIEDQRCSAIVHNAEIFGGKHSGKSIYKFQTERDFDEAINENYFFLPYGFTMAFRSTVGFGIAQIENSIDFNNPAEIEAHDQWIYFVAASVGKVRYVPKILAKYRRHAYNVTGLLARKGRLQLFLQNISQLGYLKRALWLGVCARLSFLSKLQENNFDVSDAIQLHESLKGQLWLTLQIYCGETVFQRFRFFLERELSYQSRNWKLRARLIAFIRELAFGVVLAKGAKQDRQTSVD